MRRAQLLKQSNRTQVASQDSIPAPIGGLNSRDSIAAMPVTDAVRMVNWWPTTEDVMVRKGYDDHVTGIGSQVESLMNYTTQAGTETLFCAAGTAFYNVTSAGTVGAAVVSSLTNARWQHVNFTNSSGTAYLCCFNGADSPRYWNGSSWLTITGASSPAITNVTTSTLINVSVHKRRMWMVQKDTLKAWYLPVDAVGGAAAALDLAGVATKGGYLMATATWSLDAGDGLDDYWVGITSEGEVIIYKGTDPSSGTTWSLVGVWQTGDPIGRRCMMKYGGDLLFLQKDGIFPASSLFKGRLNKESALTDKIRQDVTTAATNYSSNFGWEMLFYPNANMLLLNVPEREGSAQIQYAMNTITKAWCEFNDIEANCWAIHNDEPYFGTNGEVVKFWGSNADNDANIVGNLKTAFNYFGSRGRIKKFNLIRPIVLTNGTPDINAGLNVDFKNDDNTGTTSFTPATAGVWGTGEWGTFTWGGGSTVRTDWQTVTGNGTCAAALLKTASAGLEVRLEAVDYVFEMGGVVG